MTEPHAADEQRPCAYCPEPGADVCVRLIASASGSGYAVYAHEQCGHDRGLKPLYRVVGAAPKPRGPQLGAEHFV